MDINALPKGARCLVDANIFIYHLAAVSPDCTSFVERLAAGEFFAHVTTVVVAEVLHRRMMAETLARGIINPGQMLKKLKANPSLVTQLSDYIDEVEDLLLLPLEVTEVTTGDITASHMLRRQHGLFVNDSINLACAERLGITDIVTHDGDFPCAKSDRVESDRHLIAPSLSQIVFHNRHYRKLFRRESWKFTTARTGFYLPFRKATYRPEAKPSVPQISPLALVQSGRSERGAPLYRLKGEGHNGGRGVCPIKVEHYQVKHTNYVIGRVSRRSVNDSCRFGHLPTCQNTRRRTAKRRTSRRHRSEQTMLQAQSHATVAHQLF